MLTFFTTAKAIEGESRNIQRNARKSWTLRHPEGKVILFGDAEDAEQAAEEFGLHHEPHRERNEFGTKQLDTMFCRAQAIARHELLCYINYDIVLMEDFCEAVNRMRTERAISDGRATLGYGDRRSLGFREHGFGGAAP